jgi:excisionase family DNA binding protein
MQIQPAARAPRQLVDMNTAAGMLGVTPRTLRNWIAEGRLTAYRIGDKLIRIDRAELDALIRPIPTAGNAA